MKTTKGGQIDEIVVEYAYNPLNQLTQYTDEEGAITSYTYNPDGLRSSKTQNGSTTKFYWDRGYMSAESIGGTFTAKNHIGATGVFARETSTGIDYMLKNAHGDVTALTDSAGTITQSYIYDAFGNQLNENENDVNPFRYCSEYLDSETGLTYLRNRYYDNAIGRFITEDPIKDGLNWYIYANNNSVKYVDPNGFRSKEAADKIIKDNATYIISAAEEFGVNPGILAATIYAEQRLNVDWKDDYIDGIVGFYGVDTSIGIGQLKISTAKLIEDEGYMPEISSTDGGWNIPIIGFVHGTEQMIREKTLENSELNIRYAAAYLKYFQDKWEDVYPDIDGKTDILATLYNLGHEKTSPRSDPKPNDFGKFAKENYYHVRELLGLE